MSDKLETKDFRTKKTAMALSHAMISLLEKLSFKKITVRDICDAARISRAAFYVHFTDKYDFLEWWIMTVWLESIVNTEDSYEVKEQKVNEFVSKNKKIIKNLFIDADRWTLEALSNSLYFILHVTNNKGTEGIANPKYIILSNFYISGMISYVKWQVSNDFPENVTMMNEQLFEVIKTFQEWN